MEMFDPVHPGEIIREDHLKPLGLTVTETAKALGVTRKALSDLLNAHSGVSPEMAIRLEKAGWSTAEHWLRMQMQYELWQAKQRMGHIKQHGRAPHLRSLEAVAAPEDCRRGLSGCFCCRPYFVAHTEVDRT